ncbi:MAG: dephospho-CoA kinase, partial [Planctomycetota bacterium]|nr:dephospho-CoA kinase [Planctomycetota bacterium]
RPEVEQQLRERLGRDAVAEGNRDETRRRLACLAFADPEKLAWLEDLVHPLVAKETERRIERLARRRHAIIEAALLLAAGMERNCDRIVLIQADYSVRLDRAGRRGWDCGDLRRRDARLVPQFSPERLAGLGERLTILRNDADNGGLAASIAAAWKTWRRGNRE